MIDSLRRYVDGKLRLPQVQGFNEADFDSPDHNEAQRDILKHKPILEYIYREYSFLFIEFAKRKPVCKIIEIGSGVSILKKFVPGIITSEVVFVKDIDVVFSAFKLPFKDNSLEGLFLLFVFHHLSDATAFLDEAYRCLKKEGEMIVIDPAVTFFSRFYYRYFHVDHIDTKTNLWGFRQIGRLTSSNAALLWMVFERDKDIFFNRYPLFQITKKEYFTFLSYALSGGFRFKQLAPDWFIKILMRFENWFINNVSKQIAVTQAIVVKKD